MNKDTALKELAKIRADLKVQKDRTHLYWIDKLIERIKVDNEIRKQHHQLLQSILRVFHEDGVICDEQGILNKLWEQTS